MSIEKNTPQSLEKPEIEEAPSGELDWYDLNGKNFNAIIRDLPSDAVDKELKLTWLGTTADGEELDPEYKKHTVQWPDIFNGLKIELENDLAKAIVGGSAVIYYEIAPDLKSPSLNITVIDGTPESELKAPEVTEAIGSALSPDRVNEDGATVLIKTVAPIVKGDEILLNVVATNADETPIELNPMAEAGAQHTVFSIAKGLVEAIAGGSLALRYTVKGDTSPTLELSVDYGIIPPELEGGLHPPPGDPIKIIVPKYTGMKGDKIAISIELPHLSYRSSQEEASELEDQVFEIPFGIFISSLSTTAIVHYHVSRQIDENNEKAWTSLPLIVQIIGHGITMAPPIYLSFADDDPRYNLFYHGISVGSKVQVYWHAEGSELRQQELTIAPDGNYYYVSIPKDWLTEDKGKTVCGSYSIFQNEDTSRQYSPGVIFQA
jgi:hypothetical protein